MIRVLFFGTPDFAAHILKALASSPHSTIAAVVTNPDKPAGRGKSLTSSPVKRVADSFNIPVFQPTRLKKEFETFISQLTPYGPFDVGIVVAYGQILPRIILDLPKAGCVNIHASLLPRWRGAAPIQRAIMAGDSESGVCLMKMDEGLDTGPVYSLAKTSLIQHPDTQHATVCTAGELHDMLATLGARLLVDDLPKIVSGELQATPQSDLGITYADKIKNDEAQINWSLSSFEVRNHIHGLSPFPGAYTLLGGTRVKIFRVTPILAGLSDNVAPGSVTRCEGSELRVACGRGEEVLIHELQIEGRKRMSAQECINGHLLHESLIFDE